MWPDISPTLPLYSILDRLLRRNSMAALELHVSANPGAGSGRGSESGNGAETGAGASGKDDKERDVVGNRTGEGGEFLD